MSAEKAGNSEQVADELTTIYLDMLARGVPKETAASAVLDYITMMYGPPKEEKT